MSLIKYKAPLEAHLTDYFNDPTLGSELADILARVMSWDAPIASTTEDDEIAAFAFGMVREKNGNAQPGPVNEALAEYVIKLAATTRGAVFVQHEIFTYLEGKIATQRLVPLYPDVHEVDGTVVYLSTAGCLRKISVSVLHQPIRRLCIVGQRHHAPRCCRLAQELGFDAYLPSEALPLLWNEHDAQPWVRSPLAFALHTILANLAIERRKTLNTESPYNA